METDGTGARRAASPLLVAALDYAARGWRVLPLHAPTPAGGCTCGAASCSTGKHPRTKNGLKDATTDAATIRGWWTRWPGANVGIVTGAQSGVVVLDIDVIHDGVASLSELQRRHARLPETRSTITGSGGSHMLYRHPGGNRIIGNTVHLDGLPGLDVRGDGGYIVAPPSMHASGARYEWENDLPVEPLPDWLLTLLAKAPKPAMERPTAVRALAGDEEGETCAHWLDKALTRAAEGNRNHTGFWLACQLRDAGVRQERAEAALADYAQDVPGADYSLREAISSCRSAYREAPRERAKSVESRANPKPLPLPRRQEPAEAPENMSRNIPKAIPPEPRPEPEEPPEEPRDEARPLIIAKDRQLREMTAEAIDALEAANTPPTLFRRNRALARVRPDEKGRPVIEEVSEPILRARLTEIADFGKWIKNPAPQDADDDKFIVRPMTPPSDLVQNVLAQADWSFPPLLNIVESPVLRPDGSILTTPGYDATTQLYYAPAPGLHLPTLPAKPGKRDTRDALAYLDEVLGDFPYDGAASKAHTLALLLTAVVRPAIVGKTPMALITAPAAGTGKGLLAGLIPAIATGREPSVMTAPAKEEEWAKKITSTLMAGPSLILIDNIRGALSSGHLEAALTTTVWEDRALGTNTIVSLPQRAVWMATGNNLQLGGDMPRRCYRIRLDAKMARPERRKGFKHPEVTAWTLTHRAELLTALLILARAWYADGCPAYDVTPMGSFEEWARVVGSILAHAGVPGFLTNLEEMYEDADSERPQWAAFFAAWHDVYGSEPVTASKIAGQMCADAHHPLCGALPDDLAPALANVGMLTKKLGYALRHHVEVRFDADGGEVFLMRTKDRKDITLWRVEKVALGA